MSVNKNLLREQIGQMLLFGFKSSTLKDDDFIVKAILANEVGGVILFDFDFETRTYNHNIEHPDQLKKLTQQLQHYSAQANQLSSFNLFPLLIGIDYEGGRVNRLKEDKGFPKTLTAKQMGEADISVAKRAMEAMANTLAQCGINLNFAPVIDVNINPNNPIIGKLERSFSSDPKRVGELGLLFAKAHQEKGVMCAFKHFPGHGSSTGDTHLGMVDITATWKEVELKPYLEILTKSDVDMIMTGHVVHLDLDQNGYPASLSSAITTDLLRNKLHFEGLVVTDDLQMGAIKNHYLLDDVVTLVINAGADLLLFGNQLNGFILKPSTIIDLIVKNIEKETISINRIQESYERIKKLKNKLRTLNAFKNETLCV